MRRRAVRGDARPGISLRVYFEYSSTMSCSCTGAVISRRSGLRSTLAVSASWSAWSQAGTCAVSSVASRMTPSAPVSGLDRDDVAVAHLIAGDVDPAAVDGPMAVADELARLAPRRREAESHEHVVEAALEQRQQVLAGDPRLARGLVVVQAELLLEHAVVAAGLLLLAQLDAVLRLALAAAAVVARRVAAALDAALVGQAALALEEQLLALAAALLALGSGIACHRLRPAAACEGGSRCGPAG